MISERIDEGHDGRPQGPSPRIHAAPAPTRYPDDFVRGMRFGRNELRPYNFSYTVKANQTNHMKDKKPLGTQRPQQTPTPANQARHSLPWSSLEQQVVRMQKQISQACQRGDRQ